MRVIMGTGMQVEGRSGMLGKWGLQAGGLEIVAERAAGNRGYYNLIELGSLERNKHQ